MPNPVQPYRFSYTDDEPLPMWAQLAANARPVTPDALPPGLARDAISNPEDEAQRAQRIAEEAGRAARGADPAARTALASGGSVGRGVFAPPSDPDESIASLALTGAQDILPGIAESGAELFGASPETAADIGNAVRAGATDTFRRGYLALPQGARSGVSSGFSPGAVAGEYVPLSDEIMGTVQSVRTGEPWRTSLDAASELRDRLAQQYPGSAMAGQLGQGASMAPLFGAPSEVVEGIPSVWRAAVGGGLRGAREGAYIGAMTGVDRSTHRPLVAVGEVARGLEPIGSLTPEVLGFGADVTGNALMGAGMGGAMGAASGGLGARYRQLRQIGEYGSLENAAAARLRAYDDAIASQPSADTEFLPGLDRGVLSEAQIESLATPDAPQLGDDLANYRNAAGAIQDRPVTLRGIVDESFNNDPNVLRANAVGLEARNELRMLRQNGGVRQFSEGLDRYDIMPRGDISTSDTYRARAQAVNQAAATRQGALEDAWEEAVASGRAQPIHAGEAATRLRVLADQYASLGPSGERAASELYDFADNMVDTRGVFDRGRRIASEPRSGLTIREVTHELIPEARINAMQTMDGSRRTTTEARAWRDAYSLLNDIRDEAMETGMGPQAIRDYRLARDAQRVARTVPEDGRSVRLAHRAGMVGGSSLGFSAGNSIAGLPGGALGAAAGALIGNAAGRRWVQYEPAVMAAMADPAAGSVAARARGVLGNVADRLTSPVEAAMAPATPSIVARLALSAPESLGRYGRVLSDAARRGTVDAVLASIQRHDPHAAAEINAAAATASPEITDQEALDNHYLRQTGASDTVEDAEALDDYHLNRANRSTPAR